jgi:hypothetical protein
MHCFTHQETVAVGLCKCCAKGVCNACATPVTNGLACSANCASVAQSLSTLQLASIRNTNLYRAQRIVQPVIAVGILAIGVGYLHSYPTDYLGWVIAALGVVMGVSLLVTAIRKR